MDLVLLENTHPNPISQSSYDSLIGIEEQKENVLNTLHLLLNQGVISQWHKKHHKDKLSFLNKILDGLPLIILEGDVGCGKTALANSVATPLAKLLDKKVRCFETPSNIRGVGRVGEISNRITQAFDNVKSQLGKTNPGILIIDEADDLATSREQNQAHHEDRAGLNVLLKQLDLIAREGYNITVILITNRLAVLDPAIIRRSTQIVKFNRPDKEQRIKVFQHIFDGLSLSSSDLEELAISSSSKDNIPFSYSDLIQKAAKKAIFNAIKENKPFSKEEYLIALKSIEPSPIIN